MIALLLTLVFYITQQPQHGNLVQQGNSFTYTPNNKYSGSDTFAINSAAFQITIRNYLIISGRITYLNPNDPNDPNNGQPLNEPIMFQMRGTIPINIDDPNGPQKPYSFDLYLDANHEPYRLVLMDGTNPLDIVGYPPEIIEGYALNRSRK